VLGVPDPLLGNKLVAVIVPARLDLKVEAVRYFCGRKLPSYKVPQGIYFCSSLPKSASGKIDRNQCFEKICLDVDESR